MFFRRGIISNILKHLECYILSASKRILKLCVYVITREEIISCGLFPVRYQMEVEIKRSETWLEGPRSLDT